MPAGLVVTVSVQVMQRWDGEQGAVVEILHGAVDQVVSWHHDARTQGHRGG